MFEGFLAGFRYFCFWSVDSYLAMELVTERPAALSKVTFGPSPLVPSPDMNGDTGSY
ncbi:hypothetical protein L873DRAFT_1805475 [Choiromyces venosus 120613-1]|uniref:Uncharacterized protein n=1 Tax=Choiromyces venosus 120613-1 TaxID=1336337 RepID=A0A3N4JPT4_9PEZI|nr:hypothetical protein L873DRAFT_1805475 [Choiromyces venosus 120613-1]